MLGWVLYRYIGIPVGTGFHDSNRQALQQGLGGGFGSGGAGGAGGTNPFARQQQQGQQQGGGGGGNDQPFFQI